MIIEEVRRFCTISEKCEVLDWSTFFSVRSIDYRGDEVRVARYFSWDNISPALPREIGVVPLNEVCQYGARHYVENFDLYLKPRHEWVPPTRPRVMVHEEHWDAAGRGLLDAGVCTLLGASEVFETSDGLLLNGLFGVPKDDATPEGVDIYRLIMNLVPLNGLCRPLTGDVDTLPSWSGMAPFFLQPEENLLVSSEDVKCFFYTLAVPQCWYKYLAFNRPVSDKVLPHHLRGQEVYLASKVLPMGFLNSVSLAQHVHRVLVLNSSEGNQPEKELRKDKPFSVNSENWRVYLDNYDLLEKVQATHMVDLPDEPAAGVLSLRQQYEVWGVPRRCHG